MVKLVLFWILLFNVVAYGQSKDDLDRHVQRLNLVYTPVKDYEEVAISYPEDNFVPRSNSGILNGFMYKIKPIKDDVIIVFSFFDTDTAGKNFSSAYEYSEDNHIVKMNYLIDNRELFLEEDGMVTELKRDSTFDSGKVKLFAGKELKKYGADDAGIIDVPVDRPYRGKYNKLKVFFMYKKGEGEVYKYYFYNDETSIDKYIKDTEYVLTFKNYSAFNH